MAAPIIPREQVAQHLAVSTAQLIRYEARGLVHSDQEGAIEGYSPAEFRRLWTVVTLQRDLGINLAGVEAVLRLRDQLETLHGRLAALAREMDEAVATSADGDDGTE